MYVYIYTHTDINQCKKSIVFHENRQLEGRSKIIHFQSSFLVIFLMLLQGINSQNLNIAKWKMANAKLKMASGNSHGVFLALDLEIQESTMIYCP